MWTFRRLSVNRLCSLWKSRHSLMMLSPALQIFTSMFFGYPRRLLMWVFASRIILSALFPYATCLNQILREARLFEVSWISFLLHFHNAIKSSISKNLFRRLSSECLKWILEGNTNTHSSRIAYSRWLKVKILKKISQKHSLNGGIFCIFQLSSP